MSKDSPKYELNQNVYQFPEFNFNFKFNPLKVKRRVIDELADGVIDVHYYIGDIIYPIEERKLFANEKELAEILILKLNVIINELKDKYGLTELNTPHVVHPPFEVEDHPEIKQDSHTEESDEEMRKQGYYKNEKGEWEWDRDLATSQEYGEIMQEEIKKCKIETAKKYYDTSELSKEESSRIKSILREFGREDLAEDCSDFEGIGCIIDIFVNYFREFGIAKPLDNDNINKFIDEILKSSIHDGNHFYVQEFVLAIAKKSIEIIKG